MSQTSEERYAQAATPNIVINNTVGPSYRAQPPKSVGVAWALWALSFIGLAGLHRFYLGKGGTGILWLLTFGLFFIGTIIDAFTLASQVKTWNRYNSDAGH